MSAPKKVYPQAILKNLTQAKQAAVFEYLDGSNGVSGHSLAATIVWLREDGIKTSACPLSEFRSWYLMRKILDNNEARVKQVVERGREQGWIKTSEEAQAAGQTFFTELAIAQQDNLGFVRILREQTRSKQAKVNRDKFEFDAATACLKVLPALKEIAGNAKLDQNAKIDEIRQQLFGELAE